MNEIQQDARTVIASPGWALRELNLFDQARMDYRGAMDAAGAARAEAQRVREDLKAIEAEVVVNGGHGAVLIDGRNEATRSAQTLAACHALPKFKEAAEYLREHERAYAEAENAAQEAVNVMRRVRLALDFASAWMSREAANERGSAMEERNGNSNR